MASQDSNEWAGHASPGMVSLFDDMVLLYPLTMRSSTSDVGCCTDICRRLALSSWTARLRVIESQIAQEHTEMSMENPFTAKSTDELFQRSWTRAWQPKDFRRLVRAATALESIGVELQRNLDALGVNSSDSILSTWEVDAWQNLLRATHLYKSRVDAILQTYMQAVSVRQSITTGQLTSMAAIFIPVSLVAAIFSMGGKFAAGESLFWVFWVIAIPMAFIGCILLFSKIGRRGFRLSTPQSSLA
ncbi:magnesium and cobalt transport protein [Colletotrichum chrysophilum]|uniref:Magnesium and cobalt transport protein n=1 Tax=Colletotrichum chrysophilum TaxID=1836956 RepID=A0AAD9AF53_9PEZI|nr:magnesium and cobalt transport protein [Colletotrichum chrysophilum]